MQPLELKAETLYRVLSCIKISFCCS